MSELLRARDLTKSFRSNTALNGLNLSVNEKEIVCLLGANGAGKTTINLFLGFLEPCSASKAKRSSQDWLAAWRQ